MKARRNPAESLIPALEAIRNLTLHDLSTIFDSGSHGALIAHFEIETASVSQKSGRFYHYLLPWKKDLVSLLAKSYRRFFKLALAHPGQTGRDPHDWACSQLQPAVREALERIHDWYILACDGKNQCVRHEGTIPFVPGQTVSLPIPLTIPPFPPPTSWRAPAWLFQVAPFLGIGPLKSEHVPVRDSEQKLGAAHTRLLLRGGRRVFLWELGAAVETVRNEEIAAAGAIPGQPVGKQAEEDKASKDRFRGKGTEGLVRKADLSEYMDNLTEKQQLAFSLRYEYELGLAEIALRMDCDRKTAYEHIEAANRRIAQARSSEKGKVSRAKSTRE